MPVAGLLLKGEYQMNIAVLFASHQKGGKHEEIKQMLRSLDTPHKFEFIELADYKLLPCLVDCKGCVIKTEHRCLYDDTGKIQSRLQSADINFIVVPQYYPYPSKFVALMEKLLGSCFRQENRPLKEKPTAIFRYCSCKILDDSELKILWQQFLMDRGYDFYKPSYPFINKESDPDQKYDSDIVAYVKDVALSL